MMLEHYNEFVEVSHIPVLHLPPKSTHVHTMVQMLRLDASSSNISIRYSPSHQNKGLYQRVPR
jgi:hypothetical protein